MAFVGRTRALARLLSVVEEAAGGRARLVLVGGEAGIGKTTLVGEAAARSGLSVGWGTCGEGLPALWPWTTALRGLLGALDPADAHALTRTDTPELARLLPELGQPDAEVPDGDDARLRQFDAVARFLERLARHTPALVVLDDLQWADGSTLALLRFLTHAYRPVPLVLACAYRHDELGPGAAAAVSDLARTAETLALHGLSADEVGELVTAAIGGPGAQRWAEEVHRRTGGHPFLARQLAELLADPAQPVDAVPPVARDLVARRVGRLSPGCRALVEALAVAGTPLPPDVLAEVCGTGAAGVAALVEQGVRAGVLVLDGDGGTEGPGDTDGARARPAHDLFRETIAAGLAVTERMELHRRTADALEHRHARGAAVVPADVARHCAAAVPLEGGDRAVRWARAAARADAARLAFADAAAHLARARRALEDAGDPDTAGTVVDLIVEEAGARARAGEPGARALLDDAWERAGALGDAERLGGVALGVQRLGARFATARDAVVAMLETARAALDGTGTGLEAQLTASLARELHHSVPAQRPRARPLTQRAIALARRLDDPATLAACLLARHDVLWTPGRAAERIPLAREIAELAERTGDAERHAEGLLLLANALLEEGSPAFRAALADWLEVTAGSGRPRHDYLVLTRRGALALADGRLDEAEGLIGESSALGERIGEPDTGNVRMSQLLGLVRARRDPGRLRATAAEAVRWWVGVPSHAHAVAAGLYALAGGPDDLVAARRALDTVVALDTWHADRSYLWSVFVGAMATAAVALEDRALCAQLLAEVEPVAGSCGVNGALVCFVGSNAHWAGVLCGALGRTDDARAHLTAALAVHRRLGAVDWVAETERELAALEAPAPRADAELRRDGELWRVGHRGSAAHLRDLKGLADLAVLLARPGTDVHVLELAGAGHHERDSGTLLDPTARVNYRRRLAELDEDLADAHAADDRGRVRSLDVQREALLAELGRAAGLGGRARPLGASTTERARKAVTARVREAIARIGAVLPEVGAHLDRSVLTGATCRYDPVEPWTWRL